MHANPLVTICVPTFNGARYLDECLASVFRQTYAHFEVLLVDDCSTDETLQIARRYAIRDPRLRIVSNQWNLGLVGNWNRCVELAGGEWIKFVFQDDLIAPRCVERMLDAAQPDASLIFCRREFIFEEGTAQSKRNSYLEGRSVAERLFPESAFVTARQFSEIAVEYMDRNFIGEPTVVMLHRRVFDAFGGFNPHLIVSCDTEFWLRVGIHTGAIHVAENLASFRVHGDSVSARSVLQRDYRVSVLDGLATLHEAAFNPRYAPLRAVAKALSVDLTRRFRSKALWAYGLASRAARDTKNPDPSLLEQWQEVAVHFRGLRSVPLRYRIIRQWRMVLERCRALAGLNEPGN